ncbi:MAG: coiled-coil protein [Candidatus Kariarchaeaceae archaeon]
MVSTSGVISLAIEMKYEIDPSLEGRERLKRLREIKSDLIGHVREEEGKRDVLRKLRDEENQQVKELFEEARVSRERRDEVNEDVKLNKALRDLRKEDADKVLNELEAVEDQMKELGVKPKERKNKKFNITRRIRDLETTLETTANLHPQQEKELIDSIERLYQDFDQMEVADEKRDEIREIQNRLRSLRNAAMSHHKEVKKLASQSQEYHDFMLEKIRAARKLRASADKNHKDVLEITQKIKGIRKEISTISNETDELRKKLGEETAVDRKKRKQHEARVREKDLDEQASEIYERYKSGEKLGFEEFKLIISRGLLNE